MLENRAHSRKPFSFMHLAPRRPDGEEGHLVFITLRERQIQLENAQQITGLVQSAFLTSQSEKCFIIAADAESL